MSNVRVILNNNTEVLITNVDELQFDFANENAGFQPQREQTFFPEFVKTNDTLDGVAFIKDWINQFTILRKLPIKIEHEQTGITIFNGFINLADSANAFDDERGQYKVKAQTDNEDFFTLAENLKLRTLEYQESEFEYTAYIIDFIPDFATAAILSLSLYSMLKTLYDAIKALADIPAFTLGTAIATIVYFIYIASLIIGVVALLRDLGEYLFQKPRFYRSINVQYLMQKACASLGYGFNSSIFTGDFERLRYIAATSKPGREKGRIPRNNPIPDKTLLEFFDDISKMFNARLRVFGGVVYFDSFNELFTNPGNYQIPQLKRNGTYSYNFDELPSTFKLQFNEDFSDLNIEKNNVLVSYTANGLLYDDSNLTKDEVINIPFCVAKRKDKTKRWEKIFNSLFDVFNGSAITLGQSGKIGSRDGFMSLWNDSISLDRVFIGSASRPELIDPVSTDRLKAVNLYYDFYESTSPPNFQFKIWKGSDDRPICKIDEAIELYYNPVCRDWENNIALMISNKREARSTYHSMEFRTRLSATDTAFIPQSKWEITVQESFFEDETDKD